MKVPQLRFNGFDDEWEEKRFEECFSERNERSSDGELISVTINNGIKKAEELERFVHIADKSNYKVVKKGDLAYNTMRMWQGASGYSPYSGILSPAYTVLCPNDNTDSLFHSYLFKKTNIIHLFEINSQGLTSDTWNLKYDAFSQIKANIPSKSEQQKIGSFLSKIDSLIQAKTQKLESLKSVKKSLLQKCFPKEGEKVPEMRFEGFSGNWKEKKFGDVVTRITETSDIPQLPRVEYEDIISEGLLREDFITKCSDKKGIHFHKNYILFGKLRAYLKNNILAAFEGIAVGDFWVLESKVLDSKFLFILIGSDSFQEVANISAGSKMPRSDWSLVSDYNLLFPSTLAEQQKIGQFFSKYDSLISLQQKEIDNLKTIKKSLLQKMFV